MPIAIDSEGNAHDTCRILQCVVVQTYNPTGAIVGHDPRLPGFLAEAYREGVITAGGKYDALSFMRLSPTLIAPILDAYEAGRVVDVLVDDRIIEMALGTHYEGRGYNLDAVSKRRAGVSTPKDDPWRFRYGELLGKELDEYPLEAVAYMMRDPYHTYLSWLGQQRYREFLGTSPIHTRAGVPLDFMSAAGIHTDQAQVEKVNRAIVDELDRQLGALVDAGLVHWDGVKYVDQAYWVTYKRQWWGPYGSQVSAGKVAEQVRPKAFHRNEKAARALLDSWCAENGVVLREEDGDVGKKGSSLSADTLGRLNLPDGHALDAYRRTGSLQSMRSKLDRRRHEKIYTRYTEMLETGRTSSSGYKPPKEKSLPDRSVNSDNLQNQIRPATMQKLLPHYDVDAEGGFREMLVPPPGHVFVVLDWSTLELVTWAEVLYRLFGRSRLREVINDGRDVHAEMACTILGIDYSQYTKKTHGGARQLAKIPNFGYPGGLGAKRMVDFARTQYEKIIDEETARSWKRHWQQCWPEAKDYFAWIGMFKDHAGKYAFKHPVTGRYRSGMGFTEACNWVFQGLAAIAAKDALWRIFRECIEGRLRGCYQCLFVHDENVMVAPRERAQEVAVVVDRIMVEAVQRWCPNVRNKTEASIVERYCK